MCCLALGIGFAVFPGSILCGQISQLSERYVAVFYLIFRILTHLWLGTSSEFRIHVASISISVELWHKHEGMVRWGTSVALSSSVKLVGPIRRLVRISLIDADWT